ncbi:MAG TPA: hypothetical protein VJT75_00905 [Thermoleophilaceae bacterium]|nr:hypothetical protein [Thermoleophilaceae bacterium]
MGTTYPPQSGAGGGAQLGDVSISFAGLGKGEFVERIVREFDRQSEFTVDSSALAWLVNSALVPDPQWDEAVKAGTLDLPATAQILWELLEDAGKQVGAAGEYAILESHVSVAFEAVVRKRHRCPFPFWC